MSDTLKGRYTGNASQTRLSGDNVEQAVAAERERVLGLAKGYMSNASYHELRRTAGAGVNREQAEAIESAAPSSAFMTRAKKIRDEEGLSMTEAIRECRKRHPGLHAAMLKGE